MGTSYWGYFLEPFPHRSRDLSGKEIIDFLVHFSPSVFCRTGSRLVVAWNVAQSGLRHQCYHLHHPHYPHHPHYHHYHLISIIFNILIIIRIISSLSSSSSLYNCFFLVSFFVFLNLTSSVGSFRSGTF